jgi:hypothetical protein
VNLPSMLQYDVGILLLPCPAPSPHQRPARQGKGMKNKIEEKKRPLRTSSLVHFRMLLDLLT